MCMHNRFALRVFERGGDDAAQALAALQLDAVNDSAFTTVNECTAVHTSDSSGFDAAELLLLRMFVGQDCAAVCTVHASDVAAAVVKRRGSRRVTDHVIDDVTTAATSNTMNSTAAAAATAAGAASATAATVVASDAERTPTAPASTASTTLPTLKPSASPVKPQAPKRDVATSAVSNARSHGECFTNLVFTLAVVKAG
jgi:hypothetical protein